MQTSKYDIVEKKIHKQIDRLTDLRIRQNREFFNIQPELAFEILKDEASLLDDAIVTRYQNNMPVKEDEFIEYDDENKVPHKKPKPNFKFSMVNIPIGATLVFIPTGKGKKASVETVERTQQDIPMKTIVIGIVAVLIVTFLFFWFGVVHNVWHALIGILVVAVIAFLFTTVAANAIAIVGSNPVSGMTLMTLILAVLGNTLAVWRFSRIETETSR